jgi:hypothetical protein
VPNAEAYFLPFIRIINSAVKVTVPRKSVWDYDLGCYFLA